MADPARVVARRFAVAVEVRDALYGGRTRPLGRVLRLAWADLVAYWPRRCVLTYMDVRNVAREFAAELRASGRRLEPTPETDEALRAELSERLHARAVLAKAPSDDAIAAASIRALLR